MTKDDFESWLNLSFNEWRAYEYQRDSAILIIVLENTIRTDKVAPFETLRPAGVLVHFKTANWFQRWAWGLGIWKPKDWILK